MVESPPQWPVFLATGIALVGSLLYLALHVSGVVRLVMSKDPEPIDTQATVAWIISFVSGFMGPCVVPANLLAMGLGALALRGERSARTRICAQTAIVAAVAIQLMTLCMLVALAPFMLATGG